MTEKCFPRIKLFVSLSAVRMVFCAVLVHPVHKYLSKKRSRKVLAKCQHCIAVNVIIISVAKILGVASTNKRSFILELR